MESYLKEQSFGEFIRNTFNVYGRHFLPVVLTYSILVLPWELLYRVGIHDHEPVLALIGMFLVTASSLFAVAVLTLLVSDICLGNKVSLARYFKRAFGAILGKLLATNLLQTIVIMVGFVLLIIPGFLFTVWFMFSGSIVVLEEKWGTEALKRSRMLGKGYYMRNLGVLLVLLIIVVVIAGTLGGVVGGVLLPDVKGYGFIVFESLVGVVTTPLGIITFILMYYDLRVRKEAFNSEVLAEELRR